MNKTIPPILNNLFEILKNTRKWKFFIDLSENLKVEMEKSLEFPWSEVEANIYVKFYINEVDNKYLIDFETYYNITDYFETEIDKSDDGLDTIVLKENDSLDKINKVANEINKFCLENAKKYVEKYFECGEPLKSNKTDAGRCEI